jgi:hypothetical protein
MDFHQFSVLRHILGSITAPNVLGVGNPLKDPAHLSPLGCAKIWAGVSDIYYLLSGILNKKGCSSKGAPL